MHRAWPSEQQGQQRQIAPDLRSARVDCLWSRVAASESVRSTGLGAAASTLVRGRRAAQWSVHSISLMAQAQDRNLHNYKYADRRYCSAVLTDVILYCRASRSRGARARGAVSCFKRFHSAAMAYGYASFSWSGEEASSHTATYSTHIPLAAYSVHQSYA